MIQTMYRLTEQLLGQLDPTNRYLIGEFFTLFYVSVDKEITELF